MSTGGGNPIEQEGPAVETGYLVTHTHWDREWRYPVWQNRMLLVRLMDQLLSILEQDPDYAGFLLDGQSVVVEDYLEVRPENRERVERQIRAGRLSVGPWYTLPDLYPLDGESLVRNLLKGTRLSKRLGRSLPVAYESFGWGQTAQFPQIYAGFGLDTVIVAKNVSRERAPSCEFLWEAPDGTRVLATRLGEHARANFFFNAYLPILHGHAFDSGDYRLEWGRTGAAFHRADPDGSVQDHFLLETMERIREDRIPAAVEKAFAAMDDTLLPAHRMILNGSDSTTPQPLLSELVRLANRVSGTRQLVQCTLEEAVDVLKREIDREALPVVRGELRDGPAYKCSANALATRPRLKQLNRRAQVALFSVAEPLSAALSLSGSGYRPDRGFLAQGVRYLLLSHPHDSINGVTQDKTADDVAMMLGQALEIGETLADDALQHLVRSLDLAAYAPEDLLLLLANPLPQPRSEVVTVSLDLPREWNAWEFDLVRPDGTRAQLQPVSREEVVVPVQDIAARPWPFLADRHVVHLETGPVPAGGHTVLRLVPRSDFNRQAVFWQDMRKSEGRDIARSAHRMENEFLSVQVEADGTLTLSDRTTGRVFQNLNYLEDTGDVGDYWIYYPPYRNRTYTSRGAPTRIWTEDNGPLLSCIAVEWTLSLPTHAFRHENGVKGESRRSDETRPVRATCRYTLRKGSRALQVRLEVDNTVEDHRMRVCFDTGLQARETAAAGHFTVDRRPVVPPRDPDGRFYPEMQTLPMQQFVDVSDGDTGFAVLGQDLFEYEASDNGEGTLSLTLFRGVRNIICTEMRSAGRFPMQKGGQSLGLLVFEYALMPHAGDWQDADLFSEADRFRIPLRLIQAGKPLGGPAAGLPPVVPMIPPEAGLFAVEPSLLRLSALKPAEDRDTFIVRIWNPADAVVEGGIRLPAGFREAYATDLDENRLERIDSARDGWIPVRAPAGRILSFEVVP